MKTLPDITESGAFILSLINQPTSFAECRQSCVVSNMKSLERVLPQDFKTKVLKCEFDSPRSFYCELRIDVDTTTFPIWLLEFEGKTYTKWIVRRSVSLYSVASKFIFKRDYVCQYSSYGIKKLKLKSKLKSSKEINCKASLLVRIKKQNKNTRYKDDFVKEGLLGIIKVNFRHNHPVDDGKSWKWLNDSYICEDIINCFKNDMSPNYANLIIPKASHQRSNFEVSSSTSNHTLNNLWIKSRYGTSNSSSEFTRPVFADEKAMPGSVNPPEERMDVDPSPLLKMQTQANGLMGFENGRTGQISGCRKLKINFKDANNKPFIDDLWFNKLKQLTATKCKAENAVYLQSLSDLTTNLEGVVHQAEEFSNKIKSFIANKNFLFKTPIDTLKVHPQFKNSTCRILSGNSAGSNGVSETSLNDSSCTDGLEIVNMVPARLQRDLPPTGELKRRNVHAGSKVWAMKTTLLGIWVKATVLSVRSTQEPTIYKVRFDNFKTLGPKVFNGKGLAYMTPSEVSVPVGTRIIARYTDEVKSNLYAGIVAEPPKVTNRGRYLIFFDDGYAQYVYHEDVFVVLSQSNDVADDIHEDLRDFMRAYLAKYPERPMVKLQVGQITKTELYSHWRETIVEEVDASMIKMRFLETDRTEWLYRGSTRLKLLYNELANAELSRLSKKNRRHNIIPRRHQDGYVEYTNENETNDDIVTIDSEDEEDFVQSRFPRRKTGGSQYMTEETKPIRNTARKSTCQLANAQNAKNKDKSIGSFPRDVKSHLGHKDRIRFDSYTRIKYVPHNCNIGCREEENPDKYRGRNPLLIPMYLGWERQLRNYRKGGPKVMIMYRAPCGRHLRNLLEIQYYLYLVKSRLTIDLFSVNAELEICTYFVAKQILYSNDDITEGKENVPVPCVNCLTDEAPPYVEYSAERFSGRGVFLNLDKNFLAGCSCTDNCQNSSKCECQQMTNEAKTGIKIGDAGYKFRRLTEPIITGIYECNEMCKCGPQCGNRVVQHGLKVRLQMFKTQFKGWGIRCLDDIDAGMFICVYAGQLSTEQGADEDGFHFGDEYLAELDHIEVVERTKEGYESDVTDIEIEISPKPKLKEEESDYNQSSASSDSDLNMYADSDSDFESSNLRSTASSTYATRSRYKKKRSSGPSPSLDDEFDNNETDTKELPDISTSFDSYPIVPRPLSPHSAAIVESTEIQRKPKLGDDDDSGPKNVARKSVSMKHPMTPLMPTPKVRKFKSVRSYYGEDSVYIMDAKCKGNIGRYLNHSCSPNVFVQNVFYDTYDLRFPTVAFFAQHYITAGTELTWDYNYEVGSVSGKVMRCHCDARTCRGRLL